jgi:2-dehydro-3-deoxygalactonokinase
MMISCDWGTSAFRLRLVEKGSVIASIQSNNGIASAFADWKRSGLPEERRLDFHRAILKSALEDLQRAHAVDLDGVPVILSGMASSSIGMLELPYHPLPFSLSGEDLEPAMLPATTDFPNAIVLVPGVRSADDVMRGEETQLIGCTGLTLREERSQGTSLSSEGRYFIFPGTHSKHIVAIRGQAVAFSTYMTGEFFSLLSKQSILAASVEASPLSFAAFIAGIDAARKASILHSAFLVRTNQLFGNFSKADNYHYLSGLLIGEELKGLNKLRPLTLVAGAPILRSYQLALARLGFHAVEIIDADRALVEGHCHIYERHVRGNENP